MSRSLPYAQYDEALSRAWRAISSFARRRASLSALAAKRGDDRVGTDGLGETKGAS